MKKDKMFQYATNREIIKDTELITEEEANDLWVKYINDAKSKLRDGEEPQMCIWINCKKNGDYHTKDEIKDLDYSDCEYINGRVYRVIKTMIA